MRAMKIDHVAFLVLVAAACGSKPATQTTPPNNQPPAAAQGDGDMELKQDLERICNAFELSGAKPDSGLTEAGPWLEKNVHTPEAKEMLEQLKKGIPEVAREEAKRHNVAPCPLLDPKGPPTYSEGLPSKPVGTH
jgi:hypothetical protein